MPSRPDASRFDHPNDALTALAGKLRVVSSAPESTDPCGRVLCEAVVADRDSPAADVSAMDGYAIRMAHLGQPQVNVLGQAQAGAEPPSMPDAGVLRIFTGAVIPPGCEAVVKREDTIEGDGVISWREAANKTTAGDHIRRQGENTPVGDQVLASGVQLLPAQMATLANFGLVRPALLRAVRVSLITTGNEVHQDPDSVPMPWQLHNSNRHATRAILQGKPWIEVVAVRHVDDRLDELVATMKGCLQDSDAILLTGGVSMGDYDLVPEAVEKLTAELSFHGLPVRPGKPILGASTSDGKLILGLPGNPVSATIGCHRFAIPLLAKQSGQTNWLPPCPTVKLRDGGDRTLPLFAMRLVRLTQDGIATIVPSKGSGDLISLGQSTGYVEVPPGQTGEGPWPYHAW